MKHFIAIITLFSFVSPFAVLAADAGRVDSFQMPAWIERDGVKKALRANTPLQSGDILSTGKNARLLVTLEEGSSVKLGEKGILDLKVIKAPAKKEGVYEGVMDVLRGAFRFTTELISKNRKRNIDVRIGVVTAGIRGTDIWGSPRGDKDILCLIEGNITAQRDGEAAFTMNDPLSFYIVPKDQPALPIKPVPTAKLAGWAKETDLIPTGGTISSNGEWATNLMSLSNLETAQSFQIKLEAAGYATDITTKIINGGKWYRVRVEGFISFADTQAFAAAMEGKFGINQAWAYRF